ncbi:FAD-dependent oxidoreductase [Nonomuraea jiangxiensis]|uniref:Thioredoxin reductase (NADPH) n=1 Tax=Nonomuraea jiangxiensis TaxID=633440 RepID=A0A1G8S3C1_9ACTN|nr:FAD-dependent oxidoreductase [Nonomuraea jiangxiensis]SDJ23738.1 thioredoxin reductase (NADPH) [Nonomuraea jiangxiensis]
MTQSPVTLTETPDLYGAYPRLDERRIADLSRCGERRSVSPGEVLYREGEPAGEFIVILRGKVATVEGYGSAEERTIAVHGPGRFLGELGLLTRQVGFLTAVVREAGEILAVRADQVRTLVAGDPEFGDLVLRAYLTRRTLLIGMDAGFRIIGSRYSPDARRLREFAARNRLPHRWIDLEKDKEAEALLRQLGISPQETPVVIWHGDQVLRNPSVATLAKTVGLPVPRRGDAVCDLIVVGAGPAGLAASVYGASEGLTTVVLDAVAAGGQASTSSRIENYLGFPSGISGTELAERAVIQAAKFGARLTVPAEASGLESDNGHYSVLVEGGAAVQGHAVLIATGARYRKLNVPDLEKYEGCGVYYAATPFELRMCRQAPVVLVGGGNSAGQAALYLARNASSVRMLVRGGDLSESMSRYLIDAIGRTPGIEIMFHTEVRELLGDGSLRAVRAQNNQTRQSIEIETNAMFVFIGADPHTGWLAGAVALDDRGFVTTGNDSSHGQALPPGDRAAGRVRRGGRPQRVDQTGRVRSRGGRHGGTPCARKVRQDRELTGRMVIPIPVIAVSRFEPRSTRTSSKGFRTCA